MGQQHVFAGNPLDRADALRRKPDAIAAAAADPHSRFLPFHDLRVLVRDGAELQLGWVSQEAACAFTTAPPPVLLGLQDGIAHFAIDLSEQGNIQALLGAELESRFEDARAAAMALPDTQTGILAQSRSQVDWHRRHRFCSVCGQPTQQGKGGHVRRCAACSAEHFPRTDPVAIMLILDGDHCLLGQSAGRLARTGMYSALAGFIDQGESIEEAVRREIREEAGIDVGAVQYHSSQPWPFPSSLMIGCHGQASSTTIDIDTEEMTDVRWFDRATVQAAFEQQHPTLKLPGSIAIAHHLIAAWLREEIEFA